jgi:outer membrane protein OmpA-like peptidoglycan-associated protein
MLRPAFRALLASLLPAALSVVPAFAQRSATIEIVPLARYAFYPDSLLLNSGFGVGVAAGIFMTRRLSLEAEWSYAVTRLPDSTSVTVGGMAARLVVHLPLRARSTALFGFGYSKRRYGRGLDIVEEGLGGLVGLRLGFSQRLGLRLEGTADYLAPSGGASGRTWNIAAQAGVSIYAGPLGPRDSDRDGVPNSDDRCPGTAPGRAVDPTGCALSRDSDGDGVLDGADRCPGTATGQRVDQSGCKSDLDGDGVANALDRCPATPPATEVDQFGCPPARPAPDTDGDGVPDERDRCPGTAAGVPIDALGCVVPVSASTLPARLVLRDITFATGSAALTPGDETSLRGTAASLLAEPALRFEVAGHTDNTGSRIVNERLSLARAESVRAFLVSAGVPADRLISRGYGPANPIASNATSEGRALNRRVELRRVE